MKRPHEKPETVSEGAPADTEAGQGKKFGGNMAKGWGELTRRFDQTKDEPVKVKRSKKLWEVYNWEQRRRMKRAEPGLHSQGRLEREKSRETGVQGTLLKEVYEQPHLSWGPWGTSSRKDSQAGYKDAWGRASVREPLSWAARESGPAFDQLCDFCPIYFLPWQDLFLHIITSGGGGGVGGSGGEVN